VDSIIAHALECDVCFELWVADFFAEKAQSQSRQTAQVHPDALWWKARLSASRSHSQAVLWPIVAARALALFGCLIAVAVSVRKLIFTSDEFVTPASTHSMGAVVAVLFAFVLSIGVWQATQHYLSRRVLTADANRH